VSDDELKVPVAPLPATLHLAGGAITCGRIFVPSTASRHEGPTRPDEWVDEPAAFFPFLPDDGIAPELINKAAVVAFTVPAWADEPDADETVPAPRLAVVVECDGATFRGEVALDLPAHRRRARDLLNAPGGFLMVRDGDSHHLVNKSRIVRVTENRSGP
jgi:hypothetical protein